MKVILLIALTFAVLSCKKDRGCYDAQLEQ
jgi:hypothetical protein